MSMMKELTAGVYNVVVVCIYTEGIWIVDVLQFLA